MSWRRDRTITLRGREAEREFLEREEEEVERVARSEIVEIEGRKYLKIRWITGKTSAAKLFGRYGRGGRPDFFRLIFGAIAGSIKEQFGSDEKFNEIRESKEFKESTSRTFEEMKSWFFNEIVPKYKIEPGDVFVITTDILVDLETGEIKWDKESCEIIYWVRSDKLAEKCKEIGIEVKEVKPPEEVEELKRKVEEIEKLKQRITELENELEKTKNEKEKLEDENRRLKIELDTLRIQIEDLKAENSRLKDENERLKKELENTKNILDNLRKILQGQSSST